MASANRFFHEVHQVARIFDLCFVKIRVPTAKKMRNAFKFCIPHSNFCIYQITPNFLPTLLNASKPLSRSSLECEAEFITRILALPCGTVG